MPVFSTPRILRPGLAVTVIVLVLSGPLAGAVVKPFSAHDLVLMERVSDPQLSPDGSQLAYQLRETDLEANKGLNSLWLRAMGGADLAPRRLTAPGLSSTSPRWSRDGQALYFLSARSGSSQVWRLALAGGDAQQVTQAPLDIGSFMLSPDGLRLLASMEVYTDCQTLACTKARLEARTAQKRSGEVYERLFIRHWDTWSNGTRSQLFVYALNEQGVAKAEPIWITRGIDGDVPSKPFGDDSEFCFTPDSRSVIFSARIAGQTEAWSTNFDLYRSPVDGTRPPENLTATNLAWDTGPMVSPDGRTLAYRAMRRAGFESDRYGIMLRDLATGATHELLPQWDRSADTLQWSADGHTLYTLADDLGQRRLFAIDVAARSVRTLTDLGTVASFTVAGNTLVYARDALDSPAQL